MRYDVKANGHLPVVRALRRDIGTDRRGELVAWRRQYLIGVGLDTVLAASIAGDLRWNLHALLELLDRGCPPALAVRILAPVGDPAGDVEVPE